MAIEIELKFLVSGEVVSTLEQLVNDFADCMITQSEVRLVNTYYDTPQQLLRQADTGLRTRCCQGEWEQTLKTAGKVIGGLHQRPEYNVALTANQPDLQLFDPAILPQGISVGELQSSLVELFTTDFNRQRWQLAKNNSEFEVVFDQGAIGCADADGNTKEVPICEIELELIKGQTGVLFAFARALVDSLEAKSLAADPLATEKEEAKALDIGPAIERDSIIRLGYQSKAARGYQLLGGHILRPKSQLEHISLGADETLESTFIKTIEYGLMFMQHHEQCFIDNPSLLALRRFSDGVALIRHSLWSFSMLVPATVSAHFRGELKWLLQSFCWVEHSRQLATLKSKTGMYRNKLNLNHSLLQLVNEEVGKVPDLAGIKAFFSTARYNRFLLEMSQWLLDKGWRKPVIAQIERREALSADHSQQDLRATATELLNQSWQSLLQLMGRRQDWNMQDYIANHQQLKRSLLTGTCIAGLYNDQQRKDFRMPWIDLSEGIDELKTLTLLQSLAARINEETTEQGEAKVDAEGLQNINGWLEQQIESLLLALEQSRKSAAKMLPYWLE